MQSKSINFNFGHFWAKYQGYSLTFWPKLAHFHHFSMCNQNQSTSISVIFGQNTKAIASSLFGQISVIGSFSSLFNVQSKSINFNFGHFWAKYQGYSLTFGQNWLISSLFTVPSISVIFGQNTKAIALNWLIFITFQCAIKINQLQFRSFFGNIPRL